MISTTASASRRTRPRNSAPGNQSSSTKSIVTLCGFRLPYRAGQSAPPTSLVKTQTIRTKADSVATATGQLGLRLNPAEREPTSTRLNLCQKCGLTLARPLSEKCASGGLPPAGNSDAWVKCSSIFKFLFIHFLNLEGFGEVRVRPVQVAFGFLRITAIVESNRQIRIEFDGFIVV